MAPMGGGGRKIAAKAREAAGPLIEYHWRGLSHVRSNQFRLGRAYGAVSSWGSR